VSPAGSAQHTHSCVSRVPRPPPFPIPARSSALLLLVPFTPCPFLFLNRPIHQPHLHCLLSAPRLLVDLPSVVWIHLGPFVIQLQPGEWISHLQQLLPSLHFTPDLTPPSWLLHPSYPPGTIELHLQLHSNRGPLVPRLLLGQLIN